MCKKVFIDTNIFIGEKFMLSNDKFEKLKTYIENDKIILLNNEITERELEVHIIKDVKEVINSYNKVLSKSPFLEILSETPIKLSAEDETYIISFLKTELIKFFDDSIKLSLEDVDIKLILEDHFNLNLLFEKTKQNEFKDAFVAQIIKKYQKKNNEKIYIISKDDGFRKTFDNNDQNFIIFENLSKFIEEKWQKITDIKNGYGDLLFATDKVAKNVAAPLIKYIYNDINSSNHKVTVLVGHDSNVTAMLSALGFKDYKLEEQVEKTPIGGKIFFEIWKDKKTNERKVKIEYVYQTLSQIRETKRLTKENPPKHTILEMKNCKIDKEGYCPYSRFMTELKKFN